MAIILLTHIASQWQSVHSAHVILESEMSQCGLIFKKLVRTLFAVFGDQQTHGLLHSLALAAYARHFPTPSTAADSRQIHGQQLLLADSKQ